MAKKRMKTSVIIYTYNSQEDIAESIESAKKLASEIVVIDQESTDKTATIAKGLGVIVLTFPHSTYVEPAREFGINQAKGDWIFILDADERMTTELADEILSIPDNQYSHYKVPRKNIFGGVKWLKHGGWWPDHQTRLIRRDSFRSWPKRIHSTPGVEGEMGYLQNPFLHYFHGDFENMVKKTIVFENIEADMLYKADKKVSTATFFRKFYGEMFRRAIKNLGFLDGQVGIIESIYQAFSKAITYLLLYEKKNSTLHPLP